jgi:outer membrane protein TolC
MKLGHSDLRRYRCLPTILVMAGCLMGLAGCSASARRMQADKAARGIIEAKQQKALGRTEPFTIETPADTLRRRLIAAQVLPISGPESVGADALPRIKHWPEKDYPKAFEDPSRHVVQATAEPLRLSLIEALQVAAYNSREYQTEKEQVFLAALDLELEADAFRNSYFGLVESLLIHDRTADESITGVENRGTLRVTRRLYSGAVLTGQIGLDLVKLLSSDGSSSIGIIADASVTIPLLAGSGRHIVTEPLTQAERNVVYSLWSFERFKRRFAVRIASDYLSVLQVADQLQNATNNYERQIRSARQSLALFQEARLSKIELDQARQAELSARDNWIAARKRLADAMDNFKQTLGLPTDAAMELDASILGDLVDAYETLGTTLSLAPERDVPPADAPIVLAEPTREGAGPLELDEQAAILTALDRRLDLRVEKGRVFDAQRRVVVSADALRAGLNIVGTASAGEGRRLGTAGLADAQLRPERGVYTLGVELDLPWERTREALAYRESYIALDQSIRRVQELEDRVKFDVRETLRRLVAARESYTINRVAVALAEQRVDQTRLERELGRPGVQIRDVLEAQADLLRAQNDLSASLISYRIAELELQRDMDVLAVNEKGLIDEYEPGNDG